MTDPGSGGVHSVQLAIDVLEAVAFADEELGVTQIAERLRMTKGSVHRHLQTLVERGYLTQNATTSRYTEVLGLGFLGDGSFALVGRERPTATTARQMAAMFFMA